MFPKLILGLIPYFMLAVQLSAADPNLIGYWDFADAKNDIVSGRVGPAGRIIRLGKASNLIKSNGKTLLKVAGKTDSKNDFGGFAVANFKFDPSAPFTIIADYLFEQEISQTYRKTKEFFAMSDGERGPGFRFIYFWGSLVVRTGDGKNIQQVGCKSSSVQVPDKRIVRFAVVYDGKTVTIYMDGKRIAKKDLTIQPCKNRNLFFGSYRAGYAYPIDGAFGNIKIYNRPFSEMEIAENHLSECETQN